MVKTLQLDLGVITPSQYQTGWYRDPNTGEYYYYDASVKQWYIHTAGLLVPLSIASETAPKTVDIAPGDTLRIEYSYRYSGPAVTVIEYASVGVYGSVTHIYDEKVSKSRSRSLPQTTTPTLYTGNLDIVLPTNTVSDWDDIECKVSGGGEELGLRYLGALNIVGLEVDFSEFTVVDYYKKE